MRYKILFLTLFLSSCVSTQHSVLKNKNGFTPYTSKGFALVYDENDFKNQIISKKLDNRKMQIAHNKLGVNKILILTNPDNNRSIEIKIAKKVKYPNFFNILITESVRKQLMLDKKFPFLEIRQRVKNKSFVAKKAVIYSEEKKVLDKAPVSKIKIDNISQNKVLKKSKNKKNKNFSIIVGVFYSEKSATNLKNNLSNNYIKKELLKVRKMGKNRFELSTGPYFSINTLKNAYFALNKYGFDNLDVKQND